MIGAIRYIHCIPYRKATATATNGGEGSCKKING
jgi:hypothetical protein